MTTRGIPQLYYGFELAMDGGEHPDNRRDMPWALAGRTASVRPEAVRAREMHAFTRQLVQIRRSAMALRYGLLVTLYVTPTFYAYARTYLDDTRVVVLNNAKEAVHLPLPLHSNPRLPTLARQHLPNGRVLVNDLNPAERLRVCEGHVQIRLPAKTGAIYRAL
jgi:glycosidase